MLPENSAEATREKPTSKLLPHHLKQLSDSGISVETAIANGVYSETDTTRIAVTLGWKNAKKLGPCLMFPVRRLDGSVAYTRVKPDRPRQRAHDGKPIKYESPKGVQQQPYFPHGIDDAVHNTDVEIIFTEGEKKSICASVNGFTCIGLTGVHGWKLKDHHALVPVLNQFKWEGRQVRIAFDSDIVDNENVQSAESHLADLLTKNGAIVRVVRIPAASDGGKQGLDDFIVANGVKAFRELLDNSETPEPPEASVYKAVLGDLPPEEVAESYCQQQYQDGVLTLRSWQGDFYKYYRGRYELLSPNDIKSDLIRYLQRTHREIKSSDVSNVYMNILAHCAVLSLRTPPLWLDGGDEVARTWDATDTFATRSHLINLRLLVEQKEGAVVPSSPHFFNFTAVDYEFNQNAPPPKRWLEFLNQLWPDEPDSIRLLRQWMGYLLTQDTRQQKILLMVGPKRSGKGTIARVIRSIVGERNCCAPTLAGIATNFGLSPLLGKSVAIIGDARLSRRTDVAATTERLLSISGEDAQTVDRKHRDPVTAQLPTRFTIISNELPRLDDASGALAGRLLILRLTKSFFGNEDKRLSDDLMAERQSILLWAIGGWKDLRDNGRLVQPQTGQDLVDQMEDLSSPVSEFVRERCVLDPNGKTLLDRLYNDFKEWSESSGVNQTPVRNVFSRDISAAFPELRRSRPRTKLVEGIPDQDDAQTRVVYFHGIKLA